MMTAASSFNASFQLEDDHISAATSLIIKTCRKKVRGLNDWVLATYAKSTTFKVENLLYVNENTFLCNKRNDVERLTVELHAHFLKY